MLRRTDAGVAVLTRAGFTPEQAAIILTVFAKLHDGLHPAEYAAAEDEETLPPSTRALPGLAPRSFPC